MPIVQREWEEVKWRRKEVEWRKKEVDWRRKESEGVDWLCGAMVTRKSVILLLWVLPSTDGVPESSSSLPIGVNLGREVRKMGNDT
jgi:hypothetical protein